MEEWRRRSVLATGATLAAGGILSSVAAGENGIDDLPDPSTEPNPEMDEQWPSFDGDAGHAKYVRDATALDGDALEVAWSADISAGRPRTVAVADDVVYTTNEEGGVALDDADGSTVWENTEIEANRPSVVDDTIYVTGNELFALDAADGDVRWQTELEPEDPIQSQTVAYESVFVVADGTLYALETDDGSVRWEIDTVTAAETPTSDEEAEYDFLDTTAAANGVVYAGAADGRGGAGLALDPETGEEIWRYHLEHYSGSRQARATATTVTLAGFDYYARFIHDAQTGDEIQKANAEGISVTLGEEIYLGGYEADQLTGTSPSGDEKWGVDVSRNVRRAIIGGDTVYVYFRETQATYGEYNGELVALDKYDGSEQWAISKADMPVGNVLAVSGDTLYVKHEDELVALREETDDGSGDEGDETDEDDSDEEPDDENRETEDDEGGDDRDEGEDDGGGANDSEDTDGDDDSDDIEDDESDDEEDDIDGDDEPDGGGDGDDESDDGDDEFSDDTADDEADSVPGFTTGAGVVGGALGLEWLRQRAAADAPAESVNERVGSEDGPE